MSSGIDGYVITETKRHIVENLINYSQVALVVYDHILTMPAEVAQVWQKKKWTAPTWLLMLNRYLLLFVVISPIGHWTPENCAPLGIARQFVFYIQDILFAVFSALRVYALRRGHFSTISVLVLALGLVPIPIGLYVNSSGPWVLLDHTYLSWVPCGELINMSPILYVRLITASTASSICQDSVIIIVTSYTLWGDYQESTNLLGLRTLSRVMLEGGVIFLSVILLLDLSEVIRFLPALAVSPVTSHAISEMGFVLQPIIISRFLLSLREVNNLNTSDPLEMTHVRFRMPTILRESFSIGNMGENLEYSRQDDDFDRDVEANDTPAGDLICGNSNIRDQDSIGHVDIREEAPV